MFAIDKRRGRDLFTGLLIRGTSFFVFAAVLGMFLQIIVAAFPLFQSASFQPLADDNAGTSLSRLKDDQPSWVPEGYQDITWTRRRQSQLWVGLTPAGQLEGAYRTREPNSLRWHSRELHFPRLKTAPSFIHLMSAPGWLLVASRDGTAGIIDIATNERYDSTLPAHRGMITMPGGRSYLLVGSHHLTQIQPVFRSNGPRLRVLRDFPIADKVSGIAVAPGGQRLLVATGSGDVQLFHMSTGEHLTSLQREGSVNEVGWLGDDTMFLVDSDGQTRYWRVDTSKSGVTLQSLFAPVQYQGYEDVAWVWQPNGASRGYEAKLSLTPLIVGTLKAAFIALFFALPPAIGAAIFIGFFVSSSTRDKLKPTMELIAAFPTVVIGAIGAIWLAPRLNSSLIPMTGAVMTILVGILMTVLLRHRFGYLRRLHHSLAYLLLLLLPVVVGLGVVGWYLGGGVEQWLFGGSLIDWLYTHFSITAQQRNGVLVGLAMGFAIIPTVFTIAEDAIHGVPRLLAAGSLALGASRWQSFRDVVLPVASPGIIAGVMLGFGRGIGETMILLLLAGNAPLTDWSLLHGLRSLSATLAIELPETIVGSTHYRVLFLAALLLFALTFLCNTAAQLLKRHLTRRYGMDL